MDNVVLNRCVTSVKRQNSAKEFILISSVHEVLVRSLMSNVDVTSHNVSDGMNLERERERDTCIPTGGIRDLSVSTLYFCNNRIFYTCYSPTFQLPAYSAVLLHFVLQLNRLQDFVCYIYIF